MSVQQFGLPSLMAGAAAFFLVLAIAWPKIASSGLAVRIRSIEGEREKGWKEKPVLVKQETDGLVARPKKMLAKIFYAMHLDRQAIDGQIAKKLRMAGYRSQAAVTNYLAVRFLFPFFVFVVCAIYVPVVFGDRTSLTMAVLVAGLVGVTSFFFPDILLKNKITKRQIAITRAWPDALDLLLISIEAGMSIENAFRKATRDMERQSKELAEELSITSAELSYLQDRKTAFHNLSERTGLEEVKAVVTVLVQGERYGTALGDSLRVLAKESRNRRMRAAEKKAAALPPKLTIPMIVFFLPILFAVIIAPSLIRALGWH